MVSLQFTYIIVSKRINSRFFKMGSNPAMPPANPPSGSIIDDHVVSTNLTKLVCVNGS